MKKATINRLLASALTVFALTACTNETTENGLDNRTPLTVTSSSIAASRATDNAWQAADAIGVALFEAGTSTLVEGNPVAGKYVTATGDGAFTAADKANTLYFPTQNKKADIVAFYPYTAIDGNLTVPVSVADQSKLSAIDLMVADKVSGKSATDDEVALTFRHQLVKLELTVDCNESAEGVDISAATLALEGTPTTATWDLTTAALEATASSVKAISIPAIYNKEKKTLSASAIIIPCDVKDVKLVVTAGEYAFDVPFTANMVLKAGTKNTLRVHLNRTEATVEATIEDWTTGVTADLESLKLTTAGTDGNIEGLADLSLWMADAPEAKVAYTWNATAEEWTSTAPFYLESLNTDATFFARHTPADEAADATTGIKDVLGNTTGASVENGGIALTLEHLMTKLSVALSRGIDFSEDVSLAGAKISIPGILPEAAMTDANVATATGEAKTYELAAATDYLFAPQTLAAGTEMTVTLANGNSYKAALVADLEMKQGTANKLTLTLSPTEMAIAVTVKEWATGATAEETLTLAVTGTAETPEGSEPTFTELTIKVADAPVISNTGENGAPFVTQYYYEKLDDGSWTSTNPIYLDELTATSTLYGFVMPTHVDGQPIVDNVTGLPDLLGTDAVSVKGGTAAFNFRHLYAQLTVKLVAGTGFTPSLDGAAIATPAMVSTANIGTDADGNTLAVATDATDTYTIASDATHIVVPQTLTANSVFTVTFANGNTYTAALAEDVALEAGKNTTLTLTLMPTATAMKATVTDWGTAAASAEVKLADVTAGDVSVTAAEGDKLTITYAPNNLTATYTYINSAWESTAPLYWDNIAKDGFTGEFSVEYVFATKTAPVEDKLVGTITGATYGSALNFNLAHITAKMTFTFKGDGTTTTDDEVAAFAKTITLGDDTYTITDGAMHFAPQALTDDNTIVLTRENGNKYTIKLTGLKDANGAAIFTDNKIEAGKHYAITLTVSETAVGISASIAEWTVVNGSGTVTPDFE